jgi:predicted ribosomally synthesized peptide with SipW-like signal peptide
MYMRKLFIALGVFAAGVLAYGAVGTGAWFTDSDTVPVSATAGVLDIDVRGPAAEGIELEGLVPDSTTGPYALEIFNQGDVDVKYRITVDETGGTGLLDHLRVTVSTGNCVGGPTGHDDFPGQVADVPVADLEVTSLLSIGGASGLPAGITHCWSFVFSMDPSVGNEAQGLDSTFDIVVEATQLDNPGWSEALVVT